MCCVPCTGFPIYPSLQFCKEGIVGPLLQMTKGRLMEPKQISLTTHSIMGRDGIPSFHALIQFSCILSRGDITPKGPKCTLESRGGRVDITMVCSSPKVHIT